MAEVNNIIKLYYLTQINHSDVGFWIINISAIFFSSTAQPQPAYKNQNQITEHNHHLAALNNTRKTNTICVPQYAQHNFVIRKTIKDECNQCGEILDARYAVFNIVSGAITVICNICKLYNCFVIEEVTTREEFTYTTRSGTSATKKTKSRRISKPIQRLSYTHKNK